MVSDWLGELGMAKFVAHHHDDGDNKPPSMIVNGRGRLPKPKDQLTGNETVPLARFYVQQVNRPWHFPAAFTFSLLLLVC